MSGNASNPATWAPTGESASDLWEERSNFVGVGLSCIAYGVHLTLFLFVAHHLIRHPPANSSSAFRGGGLSLRTRIPWGYVTYVFVLFILGTLGIAAEIRFNQLDFIDNRNFPGGPNGFVAAQYGDFINIFGTVAYVILNWLADGLVIYRFWLIYNFNRYIAALPITMLLGSFSMGVLLLYQLTQPNANLWSKMSVNFGIPYWTISASLNILVTLLIVIRLLRIRAQTRVSLSKSHAKTYTSIAAMLVESAALYSFTALFFVITYAVNSNIQNLVLPVLGQVQAIAPLLIMWRVANGQAISRSDASTLSWSANSRGGAGRGDAGGVETKISWRKSFTTAYASATNTTGTVIDLEDITPSLPETKHDASSPMSPTAFGRQTSSSIPLPPLSLKHGDSEKPAELKTYKHVDISGEQHGRKEESELDTDNTDDRAWERNARENRSSLSPTDSDKTAESVVEGGRPEMYMRKSSAPSPSSRQRYANSSPRVTRGVEVKIEREVAVDLNRWDREPGIVRYISESPRGGPGIGADAV